MSFNLVDLVKDQIGDQVMGAISNTLGMQASETSGALSGALPGLLGGLVSSADTPSGASALFDTVSKQDDGMLGDIGNLLGGNQAGNIASQGTSMLTSLLGDGALGKLAGVVASVSGVSRGNSSSLMGMLAPVIFGVIKKKVMEGGLNAGSLSTMLAGQKNNIQAAMPQGFADQLQSQGFYDSIGAQTAVAAEPVAQASQSAAPAQQPAGRGGILKWAIPLVALAVLGWLGMQFFGGKQAEDAVATVAGQASAVSDEAMQAARDAMPEGLNLDAITGEFSSVLGSTQEALTGITDVDSATAALPAIEDAAGKLGGLSDVVTRLPEAARGPIGSIVSNGLSSIQPLIEKVTAIPGVGAIVEPVIGPMMETLQGLGG